MKISSAFSRERISLCTSNRKRLLVEIESTISLIILLYNSILELNPGECSSFFGVVGAIFLLRPFVKRLDIFHETFPGQLLARIGLIVKVWNEICAEILRLDFLLQQAICLLNRARI